MSITRTAIHYERDHLGEAIVVDEVERRWFRKPVVTTRTYSKLWIETMWRGEDGRAESFPLSRLLTDLRDKWEHDHADACKGGEECAERCTESDGPDAFDCPHANAARLCGCGFCRALNSTPRNVPSLQHAYECSCGAPGRVRLQLTMAGQMSLADGLAREAENQPRRDYIPNPRTPAGGWEATDWSAAPLAKRYGVPGEVRAGQRRGRPRK